MKKQIFVYDKDMFFNHLIKKSFSDHFIIESHTTRKKVVPNSENNYAAAFFKISTLEDFHFFVTSSTLFKNLYVITSVRLFEFQISSMMSKNIVIFDFHDDVKKNIIRELDFQLKLKKLI